MKKLRFLLADVHYFTSKEAQQLLHNKFVVVIGDSNSRAIYKDLIYILQTDKMVTSSQLRQKDEESFANDCRVEFNGSHSRNDYRLVRQYHTCHHLVRFYFITRAYSPYVENILNDFRAGVEAGLAPDVVILNSCLWDLNRYHDDFPMEPPAAKAIREYRQNAEKLFQALYDILPSRSLIIWSTATPITKDARGYVIEHPHEVSAKDMIEANFYAGNLAKQYWFDVLDLHHRFRFLEHLHTADGVHWNPQAHRYITNLLLTHIAEAWQVEVEKRRLQIGVPRDENAEDQQPSPWRTMQPTHQPCLWTSSPAHNQFNSSRTCRYTHCNAEYKNRPRGRLGQGYQSAQLSGSMQPNGSHISGPNGGVRYEQDPLPCADLSSPRNYFHTQPHAGYDSWPIRSSEQEHYPHPNPSCCSHGSFHTGYDTRPISVIEQDHHPQPSPSYSCAPNSIGYDSRPIHSLEQEQCVQSYPSNYSHALQDGRPISSTEQEQCLQSYLHNYFHAPHGAGYDSRIIGVPEQALCPPLNPRSDVLVQLNARNGPWSSDGDEDDPGFPLHMEGIHRNGFSVPESFTHEEGWAPSRFPYRLPRGTWVRSRKVRTVRPQCAYNRRHAYAPYAKDWNSSRNPC